MAFWHTHQNKYKKRIYLYNINRISKCQYINYTKIKIAFAI